MIFLKTDSTHGAVSRLPEAFLIAAARLGVETRAVNRALRKAYGIGLCSVEELGAKCTSQVQQVCPTSHVRSSSAYVDLPRCPGLVGPGEYGIFRLPCEVLQCVRGVSDREDLDTPRNISVPGRAFRTSLQRQRP